MSMAKSVYTSLDGRLYHTSRLLGRTEFIAPILKTCEHVILPMIVGIKNKYLCIWAYVIHKSTVKEGIKYLRKYLSCYGVHPE